MSKVGQHKVVWVLVWLCPAAVNLAAAIDDPLVWGNFSVSAFFAGVGLGVAGMHAVAA